MPQPFRRRRKINFSIQRSFQIRLMRRVLIIALSALILASAGFLLYSNREISGSYLQGHIQMRNFLDLLLPAVIGVAAVAAVLALTITLFFPLRLAGPLYRIEKEVERIREGDLTVQLKLRQGDELRDLAEAVNRAVAGLREQIAHMKQEVSELSSSGEEWLGVADRDRVKTEEIQSFVEKIRALEKELDRIITEGRPPA